MLVILRKKLEGLLYRFSFLTNIIQIVRYYVGYIYHQLTKLVSFTYFGGYLFSDQDNFRGRQKVIRDIFQRCTKKKIKILEVGVYCGQTTLNVAKTLVKKKIDFEFTCVDLWSSFPVSKKKFSFFDKKFNENLKNKKVIKLFKYNLNAFKIDHKVKIIIGDSLIILKKLNDKFDYIILDANHKYEFINRDIINSKKLIKNNGILIGDDYEISHKTFNKLKINKKVIDEDNEDTYFSKSLKKIIHPGVTFAVYENFGNLTNRNGIFCVKYENSKFIDYFKKN